MHVVEPAQGCSHSHMARETTAEKVRALRAAIGNPPQNDVAERGGLARDYVTKVETGVNKATSDKIRRGLAKGFGVPTDVFAAYLDEDLPLTTVLALRVDVAASVPERTVAYEPAPPVEIDDADSPLERAFGQAFDPARHLPRDIENARGAVRADGQLQRLEGDLVAAARIWLDAAAHLRKQGLRVTASAILPLVTLGIKTTPQQRAAAESADDLTTAESRAKAAANGFVENPEAAARLRAARAAGRKRDDGNE